MLNYIEAKPWFDKCIKANYYTGTINVQNTHLLPNLRDKNCS